MNFELCANYVSSGWFASGAGHCEAETQTTTKILKAQRLSEILERECDGIYGLKRRRPLFGVHTPNQNLRYENFLKFKHALNSVYA